MKKRLKKTAIILTALIAVGVVYGLVTGWLGFGIPCPVNFLTAFKCPGCGVSRMFIALMKLDFQSAFLANRLLFITLPLFAVLLAVYIIRYVRTGSLKSSKIESVIYIALIVVFLIFGIVRNLPWINW